MKPEMTNPAPDGLPVTGFANLDYGEFDDAVLQGLLPFVHNFTKEQSHAEAHCPTKPDSF